MNTRKIVIGAVLLIIGLPVVLVLIVLVVYRLNKTRTGWIFWSIHEAEVLSSHVGIHALKYKVAAFTIASALAAMTGALYAHYHTYINPKSFDIWTSEFALVHIIVGGLSTAAGPVLGAIFLTIIDELLRPTEFYRIVIFGVILSFFPQAFGGVVFPALSQASGGRVTPLSCTGCTGSPVTGSSTRASRFTTSNTISWICIG